MKKINKKLIVFICVLIVMLFTGVGIFAYYSANSQKNLTISTDITNENVIEIASFEELYANAYSPSYNDESKVTVSSARKILKLTANVSLKFDLVITNDIHLNLNGKTLDLNDYSLTFKHGYAGCFNMFGGTVSQGENGTGKITIDLPYAGFFSNNVTYLSDGETQTTQANCVNILNIDSKYTAYSALYFVSNAIASDINQQVELKGYDTVHDSSFVINQAKFIDDKTSCSYNSNSSDICSYVYKDLDLPMHYLSTDVTITYTSSNPSVVSTSGKVTVPSTETDVNLTVTINHSSWGENNAISCVFKLHVVNLTNTTVKNNVAKDLIKQYLKEYYNSGSLTIKTGTTISNFYEFTQGVQLPLNALSGNLLYSYSMTDADSNLVTTTSHAITGTNAYALEPNEDCRHLVVRVNDSENLILDMYSKYVGDYETIARLILNKIYGGSIIYDSSQASKTLTQYNDLEEAINDATIFGFVSAYGISNVTYSLKANSAANTYYEYSDYVLTLVDGQTPPPKTSYLTATFTFGTGANAEIVNVDLYLNYLAESGDTLAGFLPYYNLYDPMVNEELTTEFEMPFSFSGGAPYTCYDFSTVYESHTTTGLEENFSYYTYTLGKPAGLSVTLYYNGGTRLTFNVDGTNSMTSQLDAHLTSVNKTLKDIANYGDAKYIFKIDAQNAASTDINVLLIYKYKFSTGNDWTTYQYTLDETSYITPLTSSTFVLSGGLFYNSSSSSINAVQDTNFFAWIYNNFNPTGDTILASAVTSSSFIPASWLTQDVALDITADATLSSVSNYHGIGCLTSITEVNLSGKNLSSLVSSIASMTSVTSLKLSGCSITDISSICENMSTLKVLDLSNNSIKDFNGLMNLAELEEVYIYGNNTSSTIYGSSGIINYQTYYDLEKNGIAVFNLVSEGVPQLFADSDQSNDYIRLKSIAYQDKLSKTKSITYLYKDFDDLTATNFGLENTTDGSFIWSYGGGTDEYDATYFMVTYSFTSSSVTYELVVKYYVDRY